MSFALSNLRHYYRVVVILVTFCMLGAMMIGPDVFSYTMVYMEPQDNAANSTFRVYTNGEKNILISVMAVGTLIGMYPFSWLFSHYGARFVIFLAGMLSTASTALLPICLDTSYGLAIFMRIVQGISYAADFGLVGLVVSEWAPMSEMTVTLAVLSAFTVIKSAVEMPLAGYMLNSFGWRSVYYAIGGVVIGCSLFWIILYRDDPRTVPFISGEEILKIEKDKVKKTEKKIRVPYKKILTDIHMHAMWFAAFVDVITSIMLMVYTSKLLDALGYNDTQTALFTSLPGYTYLIGKLITGILSDRVTCVSEVSKIRICNTFCLLLSAVVLLVSAITLPDAPPLQVALIIIFQFLIGMSAGAYYKGGLLMSGRYAFFVIGNIQLFKSIAVLVEPLLFSWIVPDNEFSQWKTFFYVHVALLTLGYIVYTPLVKVESDFNVKESNCKSGSDITDSSDKSDLERF